MAVVLGKRKVGQLAALTATLDLVAKTDAMCSNEKCFPRRKRWCTAKPLVDSVRQIAVCVNKANNIRLTRENAEFRREWQDKAIMFCIESETHMEVAYFEHPMPNSSINDWCAKMAKAKKAIIAWRDSDKKRLAENG